MTVAHEAVARLRDRAELLRRPPSLPLVCACAEQAASQAKPGGGFVERDHTNWDLAALRAWLKQACHGAGVQDLLEQPGRLDRAPMLLWDRHEPAASYPGLLDCLLTRAFSRRRLLANLLEAWIRDFDVAAPGFREAGMALRRALVDATHPRLVFWADADRRFELFDPDRGPMRIARALLQTEDADTLLAAIGMTDPIRATGWYLRQVIEQLLSLLPAVLRQPDASAVWARATRVLLDPEPESHHPRHRLRFSGIAMNGRVADACLKPWLDGSVASALPRESVQSFLLSTLQDPRLHPGNWSQAGPESTSRMRSWMASQTLEAFFALIGEVTDDKQWEYRRKFWKACLKKSPGMEVWVVLGADMLTRARTIPELNGNFGYHTNGSKAKQAALLIKIGRLVFREWSHIGALRAFEDTARTSPPLYNTKRDFYSKEILDPPSLEFPNNPLTGTGGGDRDPGQGLWHRKPERGLWQGCVAALIERRLGLKLAPGDYGCA